LAIEQGIHCGLTAFRDVAGLGDNLALLAMLGYFLFKASSAPWEGAVKPSRNRGLSDHSTKFAGTRMTRILFLGTCVFLYAIYRCVGRVMPTSGLPIGGCLGLEIVLIPFLMLVSDGLLLSWIVVELRDSDRVSGLDAQSYGNIEQAVDLCPAVTLACFMLLPARYVATLVLLLLLDQVPAWVMTTGFGRFLLWQLGPGLVYVQAVGLIFAGTVGAAAWSRGDLRSVVQGWLNLVREEGGHVVAILGITSVMAVLLAPIPYLVLLLLPVQTWTLAAADSYSHYLSLPVGLFGLSSLLELGRSALPYAHLDSSVESKRRGVLPKVESRMDSGLDTNLAL